MINSVIFDYTYGDIFHISNSDLSGQFTCNIINFSILPNNVSKINIYIDCSSNISYSNNVTVSYTNTIDLSNTYDITSNSFLLDPSSQFVNQELLFFSDASSQLEKIVTNIQSYDIYGNLLGDRKSVV